MQDTKFIVDQLKKDKPKAIILFGSAARGEMSKDSDLDILVIKETDKPFTDRIRETRASVRTNQALDIIVLTPEEAKKLPQNNTFLRQILKEGKLLYGRI